MVLHLADAQMSLDRCADTLNKGHCRWQCKLKVKVPGDQINKLSVESERQGKVCSVDGPTVRALAQTARGVGLSPTQCYLFSLLWRLFVRNMLFTIQWNNLRKLFSTMMVCHLADIQTDVQMSLDRHTDVLNKGHC